MTTLRHPIEELTDRLCAAASYQSVADTFRPAMASWSTGMRGEWFTKILIYHRKRRIALALILLEREINGKQNPTVQQ